MKNLLIVLLVYTTFTGCSCLKNAFAKKELRTTSDNILYSLVVLAVSVPVLAVFGGLRPVSPQTLCLAAVFGLLVAAEQIVGNEAFRRGSMSLTDLLANGGMVLTVAFACLVWKEKLTVLRAAGILLMLLSMALIVNPGKEKEEEKHPGAGKVSLLWVILSLLLFVLCGTLGIIQKMLVVSGHADEVYGFLFYNFVTASFLTALYLFFHVKIRREPVTVKLFGNRGKLAASAFFSGICNALLHITTMLAVEALPATVAFPIVDGGKLFFITLMDVLLFRQKLTRIQCAGLVLSAAAAAILA